MLPAALPRGDAPEGVRLERLPDVEDPVRRAGVTRRARMDRT